ncbi:hypothetical protein SLEP1_g19927 [Rubroshorea leprosula]|uniref:BZIP domain-containing protein n=1 Tax=Rubroshorea leprosula TaxID=152421 RepID=A0AAV5J8J9_9ROSI|nr:hypothetical protein SLEP1_g19927 [Rubroshorea leprosula]
MGIQMMGSQSNGQQSHVQPSPLMRQNSWYGLTLNEVENQLATLGKPLGSMNLDELLNNVWSSESNISSGMDSESTASAPSLQRQASLTLARALSGKTVDQVWKEILQGQKKRYGDEMKGQEREMTLGETTLEDFLVQAGLFVGETPLTPTMDSTDIMNPKSFPQQIVSSSSPLIGALSDTTVSGRKRDAQDPLERTIERRLRRKIKNRESAARSRARKQASL